MNAERDQRELSILAEADRKIRCPICCDPCETEVKTDLALVWDPETGEKFGRLVYSDGGGELIMFNSSADGGGKLSYKLNDVLNIDEGHEIYKCRVTVKSSNDETEPRVFIHSAKLPQPEIDSEVLFTEDYRQPSHIGTLMQILTHFPEMKYKLWNNVLSNRLMIGDAIFDEDDPPAMELIHALERIPPKTIVTEKGKEYTQRFVVKKNYVRDEMVYLAKSNPHNPFIDDIRRVEWDGTPRIGKFFYECGGRASQLDKADELNYLSDVLHAVMLAVIEKNTTDMLQSDDPVPVVLLLIGPQGVQKSKLAKLLGLGKYYDNTDESITDKKKYSESVNGGVIHEWMEANQIEGDSANKIKSFIDKIVMNFRDSYAHSSSPKQVRFVLVCTTNNAVLLTDASGNRRFFPVNMDLLDAEVQVRDHDMEFMYQMWAEALVKYNEGRRWADYLYCDDKPGVLKDYFSLIQDTVTEHSEETQEVQSFLDTYFKDIGDTIYSHDLRDYLASSIQIVENGMPREIIGPCYTGSQLNHAVRMFFKTPESFGFKRGRTKSIRLKRRDNKVTTTTEFVRIREPLYKLEE